MFESGLRYEFDCWLDNTEWTDEEMKMLDNLTEEDRNNIIDRVLNDEEFTEEMFKTFNWWLNKYMSLKDNGWCK
jgi:hypothetical protein